MSRQITVDGTALPVTDATMTTTRDPVVEQSMSGKGGEILYGGLYTAPQGSFGGAYRPAVFNAYINDMLEDAPASYSIIVYDDFGNALKSATTYLTSCEISMRVGELAKVTFNFVGQAPEYTTGTPATASFSADVPIFYKSSSSWGDCSEFTMRIERPYTADDYLLGSDRFTSQSIYQSGDTKITGTVKLGQRTAYKQTDPGNITLTLAGATANVSIAITGAVLTQAELGVSGRGLINKTQAWACESDAITIT